jgi:hypothetical protein
MNVIEIKDQIRLSFAKCVELVLSGIKYRLFRAGITVTIIALAVAFLMTMLTESFVARRVADEIDVRTAPRRIFNFWVSRISSPMVEKNLSAELSDIMRGDPRWRELTAWGKLTDDQMEGLCDVARKQATYLRFFESLDEGQLRPLVGRSRQSDIFALLQNGQAYKTFEEELRTLGLKMPTELEAFREFLGKWSATLPEREAILSGNAEALRQVRTELGPQEAKVVLANADETLPQLLQKHNFGMSPDSLRAIRHQAALSVDAEHMVRLLNLGMVKNRLADRRNAKMEKIDTSMFFDETSSGKGARWLRELADEMWETIKKHEVNLPRQRREVAEMSRQAENMAERNDLLKARLATVKQSEADESAIKAAQEELKTAEREYKTFMEGKKSRSEEPDIIGLNQRSQELKRAESAARSLFPARNTIETFTPSAERIEEVANSRMTQRRLASIEQSVGRAAGREGGFLGYSSRTMWLIAVSFLVCVVGIANAMLMSVTDRFQEIATMKCLGATDGYIMINFILESCLQGTAGGVVGALLGFLLGTLRSLWSYGWIAMEHLPVGLIAVTAGISLAVGVILSAVAAVYPAWIAARLAPMEAMRIE